MKTAQLRRRRHCQRSSRIHAPVKARLGSSHPGPGFGDWNMTRAARTNCTKPCVITMHMHGTFKLRAQRLHVFVKLRLRQPEPVLPAKTLTESSHVPSWFCL